MSDVISISSGSDHDDDFAPSSSSSSGIKRESTTKSPKRVASKPKSKSSQNTSKPATKRKRHEDNEDTPDIEDLSPSIAGPSIHRPHGRGYHDTKAISELQEDLLAWFEEVREKRGMPWRKRYDPGMSMEEKGRRAYEIWVSEVMLQQTQVTTVIAYWERWIAKWPTIADLAKANIEEVNAAWRGLGYYRRARSLLAGAITVMANPKYNGRLPHDPAVLEKEIDGVGRYTAGAICSMSYGVRTPIVDGNVHRLFARLLAVHAPQTAPATIKFLWNAAEELVDALPKDPERKGIAGDWNQALMELGSQICKPASPECGSCPLQKGCKAYAELSRAPPVAESATCELCAPIPSSAGMVERIPSVTIFPMKKEKKVSREEMEVVCIVEARGTGTSGDEERRWLFTKRPEKGLLAGLFQPPTTPVPSDSTKSSQKASSLKTLSHLLGIKPNDLPDHIHKYKEIGSIQHIFSHINMTYQIHHVILNHDFSIPLTKEAEDIGGVWLTAEAVESANVGTGVKKVWAEVYGSWGNFDSDKLVSGKIKSKNVDKKAVNTTTKGTKRLAAKDLAIGDGGKVVKKIMMPLMPQRTK